MKELVEKINAEFEVFAANAAAQVEKGNKAAGTPSDAGLSPETPA